MQEQRAPQPNVIEVLDWNGPNDTENPHNWPLATRIYHTVTISLVAFIAALGSSVFAPAVPQAAEDLRVSTTVAIVGVSVYVLGLGFGPVLAAPISENWGRSPVYKISLPLLMLFTLGAGLSKSISSLIVCRLFAGIFGSPVLAVGAGTNTDLYPLYTRAISTSLFLLAPFSGSALGPVIGGFASQYKGWPWTQWCIEFAALAAFVLLLRTRETYKKIILQRRAKRLGARGPTSNSPKGVAAAKMLLTVTLFRPVHMLFTEPIVAFLSLYNSFAFAVLFTFFAAFPRIFMGTYGFSESQAGLPFVAVFVGVMLSFVSSFTLDRLMYMRLHRQAVSEGKAHIQPEHRLYAGMLGSIGLPVGLFWFAWTAEKGTHWIVPIIAAVPFGWGNLSIFTSSAMYLADTYGSMYAASALGANGLLRYTLSAAFPLFTVQMYNTLGTGWATSLLGFVSVGMLPIPWVLFKWGPRIRARSQYPTLK
ncbi:MFS multidrug transporter-like protein [Lineolata rhizophorae]|uniref:MFS multidrug transporter-like protein n=1 Tax=Lineolata rhizophorae TaxID=578093 RepID=A0A6A6P4K5_9PEZI|nr:MFS multidrug transporter-like protein [Lineolata rhizophorae]